MLVDFECTRAPWTLLTLTCTTDVACTDVRALADDKIDAAGEGKRSFESVPKVMRRQVGKSCSSRLDGCLEAYTLDEATSTFVFGVLAGSQVWR